MAKDVLSIAWDNMRRRRFATAIKLLEAKSEIYEGDFEYYVTLGIACLYVGDFGASSSYFNQARKIKITDIRLLLGQAAIFLRRGDTARAIQYYLEIQEQEPDNVIAKKALEFIRLHGDYDVICRWVDTGRIEQFYPPLGTNPEKIMMITIPAVTCVLGVCLAIFMFSNKSVNKDVRINLSAIELSAEEKNVAKEKDLSTQSYNFILSDKEITKHYSNALQYFQEHKDNASQKEVNMILNSNAVLSIKQKANILTGYYEIPDFDSISDVPTFAEVQENDVLYLNCWVDWGGKVSNVTVYDNGSYSCDLIVGDENLERYEGTINVRFDSDPAINSEKYVKILGQLLMQDGKFYIKGIKTFQSVKQNNKKL